MKEKKEQKPPLEWSFLGCLPYQEAWERQKEERRKRIAGEIEDQLLLLEHPATITLGRLRGEASLRQPIEVLEAEGVAVIRSDRGGDATLHAPGQMVGYLIVDLGKRGWPLPTFVEIVAGAFVSLLQEGGIQASYDPKAPGVWVEEAKIVAFGFHLVQGVTMHGFAFNVTTDLRLFDRIVPCGLADKGVTSLLRLGEESPSLRAFWPEVFARTEGSKPPVAALAPRIAEALQAALEEATPAQEKGVLEG